MSPAAAAARWREVWMGRRIAELGAGTEISLEHDGASRRGRGGPNNPSRQLQTAGHGLPRLREATLEHAHSNAVALRPMPHRFDPSAQPCFASHRAGRRQRGRNAQTAAEREHGKWRTPESGAELPAVGRNEERAGEAPAGDKRTPIGLPLRTQEQAAQPSGRDPRKHSTSPSKLRAERERVETGGKFSPQVAAVSGGVAVRRRPAGVRGWP